MVNPRVNPNSYRPEPPPSCSSSVQWGIPNELFIFGDSVILTVLGQLAFMPLLVLAATLCPPGVEGVLFATLMSLFNGAGVFGSEVIYIYTYIYTYIHTYIYIATAIPISYLFLSIENISCPPGVEGVLFATLMSLFNGAGLFGSEV